jgi:hypothetical protein
MKQTIFSILLCSIMLLPSCSNDDDMLIGGGCEYTQIEGTAIITAIEDAPADENNCPNNPKKVSFKFIPNDPSAPDNYKFENVLDSIQYLSINDGKNPSLTWIEANGVTVDSVYTCFREEITTGTCTPVIFSFQALDLFPDSGCN